MSKKSNLLISINYLSSSGGVARVARLMAESLYFTRILSFHGKVKEQKVTYCNKSLLKLLYELLKHILFYSPSKIVFDHIGPASLLKFIPDFLLKNKTIVVFLHDEEAWSKVSFRHSWGLDKATHLLCNSQYTYKRFIQSNPTYTNKTQVCLLAGVPVAFREIANYEQKMKIGVLEKRYCLFVSRLWKQHRYKGYLELIESFEQLEKEGKRKDLSLVIIGNGDDVDFLKMEILNRKLDKIVQLFTDISDEQLVEYYKNCLALVFPSIREGFGFVFLEAMFFGKACIGVANQPAEEIIVNDVTGVLLKNNFPSTIKEVLKEINEDESKFFTMGKEGFYHYLNKFDNVHFKGRFLKCINNS